MNELQKLAHTVEPDLKFVASMKSMSIQQKEAHFI